MMILYKNTAASELVVSTTGNFYLTSTEVLKISFGMSSDDITNITAVTFSKTNRCGAHSEMSQSC